MQRPEIFRAQVATRMPKRKAFSKQNVQSCAKLVSPSPLRLHHIGNVAQQVGQAFLLSHVVQLFGIVALAPVTHQNPSLVGRHDFANFLIPMLIANLIDRQSIGVEAPQERIPTSDTPAGIIGVHHRRLAHRSP